MPFSAFSFRGFHDVYLSLSGAGTDEEHWRRQSRSLQQDHCPGSHIDLFIPVQKNQFFNLLKILLLKAHGLTLSCPELYMGLHDTLATAIQVQLAELINMVEFVKNLKI